MHEKEGLYMVYAGVGWKLGIWGLSGVYAMPMRCGKLCKLIWYDRTMFGMLWCAN